MDAGGGLAAFGQLSWGQATRQITPRSPGKLRAECQHNAFPLAFSQKRAAPGFPARNEACVGFGHKNPAAGCFLGSGRKELFLGACRGDRRVVRAFGRDRSVLQRAGMCISRPRLAPRQKSQRGQRVLHSTCFSHLLFRSCSEAGWLGPCLTNLVLPCWESWEWLEPPTIEWGAGFG